MASELKRNDKISDGIRRIAAKKISAVRKYLKHDDWGLDELESTHQVRTAVKKLRALLRLIRDEFPKGRYQEQQQALRTIARAFSPLRDTVVLARGLQKLRPKITESDYSVLQRALLAEQRRHRRNLSAAKKSLKEECKPVLEQIANWPLKQLKKRDLSYGLEKTYRRFCRAFELAEQSAENERLHNWRKRTKDLIFQLAVFQKTGSKALNQLVDELIELGTYLGDDHDLVLLEEKVDRFPAIAKRISKIVHHRRGRLQRSAFKLGASLCRRVPAPLKALVRY